MTYPGRTPSWDEIEQFCKIDGWTFVRSTGHEFWQKVLPSGGVLRTHTSFAGDKTMSPGRFGAILRKQLEVSKADFWHALQTGEPVVRPSEDATDELPSHEDYVVFHLKNFGVSDSELAEMAPEEALALLHEKWAGQ